MISKEIKYQKKDTNDVHESVEEDNKLPKEVYIIAQEIKIVKSLAGNDPKQRAKQLKKLRKWLTIRSNSSFAFDDNDLMRIWKGLYYCMWMSDKPLVQEELTEDLGKLTECFADIKTAIRFFGAFLKTMNDEWYGIDQWRMDKFLMLVRRMVRYVFRAMKKFDWAEEAIDDFNLYIHDTILEKSAIGLSMHFMDVFLEELAKVANGEIDASLIARFLKPFIKYMAHQKEIKLLAHMRNRVFYHLLNQSELGREYNEKYNAWKQMGFPTESIHDLEKEELSDAESEIDDIKSVDDSNPLDPRAGNVDVHMPMLPVDPKYIIEDIEEILYKEETNTKSRKFMKAILDNYKKYQNGVFPLGIKRMPKIKTGPLKPLVEKKIADLDNLEDELLSTTRKIKKMNKRKRKQLLSEINYDDADEENFEKLIEQSMPISPSSPKKLKPTMNEWIKDAAALEKKQFEGEQRQPKKVIKKSIKLNGSAQSEVILNKSKLLQEGKVLPKKVKLSKSLVSKCNKIDKKSIKKDEKNARVVKAQSEWEESTGEIDIFVPTEKIKQKESASKLGTDFVLNPFAKKKLKAIIASPRTPKTPKNKLIGKGQKNKLQNSIITTPSSSSKRVKIVLQKNTAQKQCEYIKQVRSSPQLPYDANKKPTKGLLKPNSMPSPINPFYKNKIALNFNTSI